MQVCLWLWANYFGVHNRPLGTRIANTYLSNSERVLEEDEQTREPVVLLTKIGKRTLKISIVVVLLLSGHPMHRLSLLTVATAPISYACPHSDILPHFCRTNHLYSLFSFIHGNLTVSPSYHFSPWSPVYQSHPFSPNCLLKTHAINDSHVYSTNLPQLLISHTSFGSSPLLHLCQIFTFYLLANDNYYYCSQVANK